MEVREWAERILTADRLEDKLVCPETISDGVAGPPLIITEPSRPPGMGFQKRLKEEKLPTTTRLSEADNRAICLHRFCGHELLAVEMMAYALLAFPEAPKHFRKGLVNTLKEEQEHVRLYMTRLEEMGVRFGDLPLYRHFWAHVKFFTSPLHYVSTVSLTFEMANLDFAPHYNRVFTQHGDLESAALMERIFKDEISHVSFGYRWLKRFKSPNQSEWDSWAGAQSPLLSPRRARGSCLNVAGRERAGIPDEWIANFRAIR